MSSIIKKVASITVLIMLIILVGVFSILWIYSNKLPDYKFLKNYKPPVSSKLYSGNGVLVSDFSSEKRIFVPFEAIPNVLINSFLSAEDKNFFYHPGVDAKGIVRAIKNNIKNALKSKRLEGASTITQQVAKNFLLSNEVSFDRKIKEAILAFRIERALSKERILELYLNQIYLGEGSYGIASASLRYFDKSINELNYSEAALLAALPKAPSRYNPYKNIKLAKYRRDLVLKNLYENQYIDQNLLNELINTDIKLSKRQRIYLEDSRYYVEDVRKKIIDTYGFDKVYKQGFNIKTPIDLNLQTKASAALRKGLEQYDRRRGWRGSLKNIKITNNWNKNLDKFKLEKSLGWEIAIIKKINKFEANIETENNIKGKIKFENLNWTRKNIGELFKVGDLVYVKNINQEDYELKQLPAVNGGIVVMDPFTGRVLAMAGGFSFNKSEYNRVTQAKRQPGSAFKPFIYALALENNFTPSTLVLDAPIVLEQGSDLKMWKPENYGKKFYGPSTLRTGVEKSRNLMTVRIAQEIGLNKITNFSKKLKIYERPEELMSISLGSAETTLLKMTSAYSSFVNGGKLVRPIFIDRIQDSQGKTIFKNQLRFCKDCDLISYTSENLPQIKNNYKQIFSPQTAYQMTSILEGVVQRGTGKKLKDLNLQLAGKTGTTNKNTDAWFIGFTSNLVIGVYVGFDNPRTLGKFETGSKTALPIFKEFVKNSVNNHEARPFKVAKGIKMMVVDASTGKKADSNSKSTIIESFKEEKIANNYKIDIDNIGDVSKTNILKFY
ncbi:penicillin-binding protein 1A [Candidatus Pelagibacter sp. RS40]|uniref:penicillin-binding protein 1A n=1 Tax=Candidatus Pelagibacter sp. RS40 TaxID=1977865 RepID=UPI000A15C27E|nr:PBP1A family penicillin-binding protein [Candidatus Pelagibacter sp. RS40]ARJ48651.1 penicillin-binding protein [Candidatus Pelagibacter sp. RS40]